MTELSKYLEIAADHNHCGSYYAVAKHLKIPPSSIYRARDTGKLADWHCLELAKIIGANPLILIASKHVDTEKNEDRRSAWKNLLKREIHKTNLKVNTAYEDGEEGLPTEKHGKNSRVVSVGSVEKQVSNKDYRK